MEQVKIKGMSCRHCVGAVRSALEEIGLTSVEVNLDSGLATFTPTTAFSEEQIIEAIDDAGFEVDSIS